MNRPQEHLDTDALAHRLRIAATEPRSYTAAERKQYMMEAAIRLEKMANTQMHHPARVIIGHCPACGGVLVQLNNYGVWEPFTCTCSWGEHREPGRVMNKWRLERDFVVCPDGDGRYVMRPTQEDAVHRTPPTTIEPVKVTGDRL